MKKYGEMQFLASSPPAVSSGEYRVRVTQEVDLPVKDKLDGGELRFCAGEKRFTIGSDVILDCYPTQNTLSDYSAVLPHVVLKKQSYPWERQISGEDSQRCQGQESENRTPWIALLLLDEGEAEEVKSMTCRELLEVKNGVFFPLAGSPVMTGEKAEDVCEVLELTPSVFRRAVPREEELEWLTHVRVTDLHAREENLITLPGYFSVVVCSRFPAAGQNAVKTRMHLVSLEGYAGYLPGGKEEDWDKKDAIRLVSLYHWEFSSKKRELESFRTLAEEMDAGSMHLYERLPEGASAAAPQEQHALERLKKGYTVCSHVVRTGEETASWYRGPLLPCAQEVSGQGGKRGADGRILYDRETGLFDMSYAAAWQLGRLMLLKSRAAAADLGKWYREVGYMGRMKQETAILERHLENIGERKAEDEKRPGGHVKSRVMGLVAWQLGEKLTGGEGAPGVFGEAGEEVGHEILDGF